MCALARHRAEPLEPGVLRTPTSSLPDDGALVERALSGDRWAEEALYARHAAEVLLLATRLLRHQADAEDVVQDAFLTAFTELDRLRAKDAFRLWLLRITVRKVHRRFRRRTLLRWLGLGQSDDRLTLEDLAAPTASPELKAELAWLDRGLAQLAPADRIAWSLRHVEGARLAEVAIACECSLATAKRRIARAEAALGLVAAEDDDE
ncbi:MAG: RNA polymerase sigma factor [Deltaproteobacteria bacterium]|nr:RNA polymerase sigma factor [Deltaproteobacteria bacterium]